MSHFHPHDVWIMTVTTTLLTFDRLSEAQEKMRQHRRRATSKDGSGRNGEKSKEEMAEFSNFEMLYTFYTKPFLEKPRENT